MEWVSDLQTHPVTELQVNVDVPDHQLTTADVAEGPDMEDHGVQVKVEPQVSINVAVISEVLIIKDVQPVHCWEWDNKSMEAEMEIVCEDISYQDFQKLGMSNCYEDTTIVGDIQHKTRKALYAKKPCPLKMKRQKNKPLHIEKSRLGIKHYPPEKEPINWVNCSMAEYDSSEISQEPEKDPLLVKEEELETDITIRDEPIMLNDNIVPWEILVRDYLNK